MPSKEDEHDVFMAMSELPPKLFLESAVEPYVPYFSESSGTSLG